MTPEEFARDSWQNETPAMPLPPIEVLRARADRFRRKIRRRNLLEYVVGAVTIAVFAGMIAFVPLPVMRIACVTLIIGICIVLWQLHKRGAPLTAPENGGQIPVLEFQRRELVRQRDALDSVLVWYLLPLVPGALLMHSAPLLDGMLLGQSKDISSTVIGVATAFIVFGLVYTLNKYAARKLQVRIEEIDRLRAA